MTHQMTPEEYSRNETFLDRTFDNIELRIKLENQTTRDVFSALRNDAIVNQLDGWEVRLYFFLKGLEAAAVISEGVATECCSMFTVLGDTLKRYERHSNGLRS